MRPVAGKERVAALRRKAFVAVRVGGSRPVLQHADGRRTVVPVQAGKDVKKGTLVSILDDCGLAWEELEALL